MDLFVGDTVSYMSDAVKAGTVTPSHNEEARARYLLYAGFGALLLFLRYEASEPGDIEAAGALELRVVHVLERVKDTQEGHRRDNRERRVWVVRRRVPRVVGDEGDHDQAGQ